MRRVIWLLASLGVTGILGFASLAGAVLPTDLAGVASAQSVGACGLSNPAFCDTFDQPQPNGNRAGDLNGVVWGASRFGGNVSVQGKADVWAATQLNLCGTLVPSVLPPNDIRICNGELMEAADDHGGTLGLAAYPKQPFDFAGRVGTVTFDIANDSQGSHAAWPQFAITDQPVPVPHPNVVEPTTWNLPNNAIGISFAAGCGSCPGSNFPPSGNTANCWTADEAWIVANHQLTTYGVFQGNGFNITGCVVRGTPGHLNHVAIQFSTTSPNIKVFATDPDSTSYREIAEGDNMPLPLTRGLTWLEDIHYNACKDLTPGCEQQHTFAWDNFGFDGPILARDLTFDVPDNNASLGLDPANGQPDIDLGYLTAKGNGRLTLAIPNVQRVENATGALLVFNTQPVNPETVSYSLNGHAAQSFPLAPVVVSSTLAVPVNLSDLVDGTNTVTFTASDNQNMTAFANIDLILQGAGGIPAAPSGGSGSAPPPQNTSTSTPTPTNTPQAASTSTFTPTPTATRTPVSTATSTSTPTLVPTSTFTPTATPTTPSASGGSTSGSSSGSCTPSTGPGPVGGVLVGSSSQPGIGNDCAVQGVAEAFRFTATASGNATAIHGFIGTSTTAGSVIFGLYTNSSSNHPGTLMAQTTVVNPARGGWSSALIRSTSITAGQTYWIAILQPANVAGSIAFSDTPQGGAPSEMSGLTGSVILPGTWTSGAATNESPISAYVATN